MTDKTIWLGRHAEGFHNVLMEYHLVDPGITARGKEQCRKLDHDTKDTAQKDVELIITSPLRSVCPAFYKSAFDCAFGALFNTSPISGSIELIVDVSHARRRALQTTLHGLPTAIERLGGKSALLVLPEAREVYLCEPREIRASQFTTDFCFEQIPQILERTLTN